MILEEDTMDKSVNNIKQKVYNSLKELNIDYFVSDHKAVFTIDEMNSIGIGHNGIIAKNLFLRDAKGKRHFLVTIRHDKKVDLKSLRSKLDSTSLSFASEERLYKHLGLNKGSVTPFGVLNDPNGHVEVVFDEDLISEHSIGIHPNDNTATVWISFSDLLNVINKNGNKVSYVSI